MYMKHEASHVEGTAGTGAHTYIHTYIHEVHMYHSFIFLVLQLQLLLVTVQVCTRTTRVVAGRVPG